MPVLPDNSYARPWSFVERFQAGEVAPRQDFDIALNDMAAGLTAALRNVNSISATIRVIGGSDTESGLPPLAEDADAWVVGPESSEYRVVFLWINSQWRRAFGFTAPRGPQGIQGLRGLQGVPGNPGPRGLQGFQGVKGDPGNYIGLNLIGSSSDIGDRPLSASEGQAWGLLEGDTIRIYMWTDGAWYDAGPITAPEAVPVAGVIYVQGNGSNANSGSSLSNAVLSIERALEIAETRGGAPTLIDIYPGVYTTQGDLDMPDGTVIRSPHRSVFVRPASGYEERNVIRAGSGCFVEGVMFEGFRVDSLTNPTVGFAFSFRPGAVIRRVPYMHKCAIRTLPTWGLVPPPLDRANGNPLVGRGGGVVLADGAVCSQYSIFPNIMTWGATPVSPNGIGYCAKNGGLINAVNAVSMWAHRHFYAMSGGQIILSACSTQFGDYSMHADGGRNIIVPTPAGVALSALPLDAARITSARTAIIDAMWLALVAGSYTTGWTADDEAFTRSDAALFLQCVEWVMTSADETPMENFAKGLFNTVGARVFSIDKLPAFTFSFNHMRDSINALSGFTSGAQTIVTGLVAALNTTLTTPPVRFEPSRITAVGHTWTANLAGVALAKIPPAFSAAPIRDSILETNGGVVVASGQDDEGNALFVGGLEISAATGELSGPPFDSAVRRIATRAAISRSF